MDSKLLKAIGLGGFDPAYIIIALLLVIIVLIVVVMLQLKNRKKLADLERRVKRLCAGRDGESLEEEIYKVLEDNQYLMTTIGQHKICLKNIYKRLEQTYQKMALIKYDAFSQMGGNLSFVLVMLDENNNGFLINSVHSINSSYCYAKEIVDGNCDIELGDEEFEALEQAKEVQIPILK